MMKLSPSKGFNIFHDFYLQRVIKCIKEKETSSIDNGKKEEESITSDRSSWDREKKLFYVLCKDEGEVIEDCIITIKGKKKIISNNVHGEEDLRFISLLSKFPKLFINVYSHIRADDGIKHHIKLQESVPIAQKLQWLGIVKKEDLTKDFKELLQVSFIYYIEDLKCVSPIVAVPKKSDIDFKPLID